MKISNISLLASCAALALSQPLDKRVVVVVETVYETAVETLDVTTTLWVKPGEHPPSASVTPKVDVVVTEPAPVSTPEVIAPKPAFKSRHKHRHTTKIRKPSVTPEAEAPPIESVTPPVAPVVTPEATSTPAAQVPPPVSPQAQFEYSYSFDPQTQQPSSTFVPPAEPVYSYSIDPQTESPTPVVTSQPQIAQKPPTASSGGACGEVGGECSGDITFYEAGLGACGWNNDGATEDVFALAHGMP